MPPSSRERLSSGAHDPNDRTRIYEAQHKNQNQKTPSQWQDLQRLEVPDLVRYYI